MTARSSSPLARLWQRSLDLVLPPLCLSCDTPVAAIDTLCPACWKQIHFIAPPFCATCGAPFDAELLDQDENASGLLCAACIAVSPHFTSARAAMLYDDASKNMALGFKHGDRIHMARALGQWMYQAASDVLRNADYIAPVPLHRGRLFQRRYNQAALLAHALARRTHKPALPDLLLRHRATPQQGHRNRAERQANVKGAFQVNQRLAARIKDKIIVLIDDVLTTGATVNECAKTLQQAGAKAVDVLTLARVKTSV